MLTILYKISTINFFIFLCGHTTCGLLSIGLKLLAGSWGLSPGPGHLLKITKSGARGRDHGKLVKTETWLSQPGPQRGTWALEKLPRLAQIRHVTDLKGIETPYSLCCDFGGYKTFTTRWSGGTVQVWVQVRAPAGHLAISSKPNRRLFQKVIEGLEGIVSGQNQQPSSLGRSPALLARVGRASTNTGRFRVGGSRCRQQQARLRKTCYHSFNTESIQEPIRF